MFHITRIIRHCGRCSSTMNFIADLPVQRLSSFSFTCAFRQFSTDSITSTKPEKEQIKIAKTPVAKKEYPKVYTRTGDKGTSSTFTGERRPKDDVVFQALGAIDELTSSLGLAREFALENSHHAYVEQLQRVQCILQDVASSVATPTSSAREAHLQKTDFGGNHVEELEEWIDHYSDQLPPLENFILPGGGKASASLHLARTICRRAERAVVPLVRENEVDSEPSRYLNRLSDYLFTIARFAAKVDKRKETVYIRPKPAKDASR